MNAIETSQIETLHAEIREEINQSRATRRIVERRIKPV